MEMEIGNGNGNAPIAGHGIAHAQGRYCARHRVLCAAMEEVTEGFVVITCVLL